jgi:uncharacterized RDD family membrane protein YckC
MSSSTMSVCAKCGTGNAAHAVYCQSCGTELVTASPASASVAYGGFWKRVVAWLIDAIVVSAGTGVVIASTFGFGVLVIFFGHWIYEALMTSSAWQATLGKRAMNMAVTDLQGQRVSFARATGRYFAKWISAMTLGVGFLIVAFTEKKQGLHDLIASTVVVVR